METRFTYSDANPKTIDERIRVAELLAQAGVVKGGPAVAFAVLQAGAELGMGPMQAVRSIHLMQGRVTLDATAVAALVQRSGKYRYIQEESTIETCTIRFEERDGDAWRTLGTSTFTIQDAQRAGLAGKGTWKAYPDQMLHARSLTKGARQYVPEVFGGAIYVPEELELVQGAPRQAEPKTEPEPQPQPQTGPTERQTKLAGRIIGLCEERFGDAAEDVLASLCDKLGVESLLELPEKKLMNTGKRLKAMTDLEAQTMFGVDLGMLTPEQVAVVKETYSLGDDAIADMIERFVKGKADLERLTAALDDIDTGSVDTVRRAIADAFGAEQA